MEHFEKSIIPVIESVYPSFTPLERTVADFFIHNTDESDLSARHVSELLYVSEASLSRFAKKCGYTGYREFVYRYQEGLNATLPGQAGGVAFFQLVGKVEVVLCVLFHAGKESFLS